MKRKQQELLSDGYVLSQGNLSNCVQIMSHFFVANTILGIY